MVRADREMGTEQRCSVKLVAAKGDGAAMQGESKSKPLRGDGKARDGKKRKRTNVAHEEEGAPVAVDPYGGGDLPRSQQATANEGDVDEEVRDRAVVDPYGGGVHASGKVKEGEKKKKKG